MEFNSLPLDVHLEIFSWLSAPDVMKIRLVCRQWNVEINSHFKFKRLSCNESSRLFGYEFCSTSIRTFLDYTSTDSKFCRVRCLDAKLYPKLYPTYDQLDDAFDFLNSFKFLEDLKLDCLIVVLWRVNQEVEKKLVLSLDLLKKADICFSFKVDDFKPNVLLDLRSLLHLKISSWKNVTIGYPEVLRTLSVRSLFYENPDYSKFTGLTKISTGSDARSISAHFIESLPSLKELHFGYGLDSDFDRSLAPSSDKAALKIFYFGFEFDLDEFRSERFPSSLYGLSKKSIQFIARNLHRSIDNNPNIFSVDYNAWYRALDAEMFAVMPQKFPNIRRLHITGAVADENQLLRFFHQFKFDYLELKRASLSRKFFKKLPEYGQFINWLVIKSEPTMDILSGDFDFVFHLKNLRNLHFENYPLPLNYIARLMRELKSIKRVKFHQPQTYWFSLCPDQIIVLEVYKTGYKSLSLTREFTAEKAAELIENLSSPLKATGFVCPKKLLAQLREFSLKSNLASS